MRPASARHTAPGVGVIAGLLLAAGGASRFGSQKLVAPFRGEPLVRHAASRLASVTDGGLAVVGKDADTVRGALSGCGLTVVENPNWRDGLSSSLKFGLANLDPSVDAVIVALGDQPELDAEVSTLTGDMGAKPLMDRFPYRVGYVDVDAEIPYDVDRREDLTANDR